MNEENANSVVETLLTIRHVNGTHEFKETVEVDVWYPDHVQREESNLFSRTKHHLINKLDTPCWICGSKEKREVHHFIVEWAYADAIDWDKIKADYPDFDWSSFKTAEDFVDSEFNMRVLCAIHHRGKGYGIHEMPYPIWVVQRYLKKGFDYDGPDKPLYLHPPKA